MTTMGSGRRTSTGGGGGGVTNVRERVANAAEACRAVCVRMVEIVAATPAVIGGAVGVAGRGVKDVMGKGGAAVVKVVTPPRGILVLVAACFAAVLALVLVLMLGVAVQPPSDWQLQLQQLARNGMDGISSSIPTSWKLLGGGGAGLGSSVSESSSELSGLAASLGQKGDVVDALAKSVKTLLVRLEDQEKESRRLGDLNAELKAKVEGATASLMKLEQGNSKASLGGDGDPASAAPAMAPVDAMTRAEVDAALDLRFTAAETARADLEKRLTDVVESWGAKPVVTQSHVEEAVNKFIDVYYADRTGLVDYAYAGTGGSVVAHSGLVAGAPLPKSLVQQARLALGLARVHPRANEWVLSPKAGVPGSCLPLAGREGFIDIKLRTAIAIEALSVEHVPRSISYDIGTAPRRMSIFGWRADGDEEEDDRGIAGGGDDDDAGGIADMAAAVSSFVAKMVVGDAGEARDDSTLLLLGANIEYDIGGRAVQTFALPGTTSDSAVVTHVRFRVHENWGHPNHTCIYRLRVHGKPATRHGR